MSFKQMLKMKLPFTRKGLEDCLDEKLAVMNAQFDKRVSDLQNAVIEQLKEEMNLQFHRRVNDLERAMEMQTGTQRELLFEQLKEEMNLQFHRRINDLQQAVEVQTGAQRELLFNQLKEEMNLQFHRRINDLQQAMEVQTGTQRELLFNQLKEEMNQQFHRRTNDLDHAVTVAKNEICGFLRRFPKTMLSFEVALAEHCNLNCVGCNHCAPLASPKFADIEEFTCDFKRIAYLFGERTQQIRLEGGEPLLNCDINKYLIIARDCFPEAEIIIITNGLLLPQMDDSFWETCRENQITITPTRYPINFDYDAAEELARVHNVEYRYFDDRAATTKMFWKFPFDFRGLQKSEENYRMCFDANSCITLKHGRLYTCAIAPNAHYLNEAFGTQLRESPYDSIDIYQAKSAEEIFEFLAKPIPFCRYCRRDIVIDDIPWSQSKRELSEWTL